MNTEIVEAIEEHLTRADRVTQLWELFRKHQENIEAIPMILEAIPIILSAIASFEAYQDGDGTIRVGTTSEFDDWMKKREDDAYVAYLATLPVVTANQAQTIKALLKVIPFSYSGESEEKSEERFLAEVAAPRIEDIRGFERVMKLLGQRLPYRLEADQVQTIKALLKEADSGGREAFLDARAAPTGIGGETVHCLVSSEQ